MEKTNIFSPHIKQTFLELQQLVFSPLVVFVVVAELVHLQHVDQGRFLSGGKGKKG